MKNFFKELYNKLNKNQDVILCSIIASSGSAPRGKGAKMLVMEDGSIAGTIGGGAVEYKAIQMALEYLNNKQSSTQEFNLSKDDVLNLGMVCGGHVTVYFRYFSHTNSRDVEISKYLVSVFEKDETVWLITEVSEKETGKIGTYSKSDGIKFIDIDFESISPYLVEKAKLNRNNFFIEPIVTPGYTYIFGGGHVSQALVPVISKLGFKPIILEDRKQFTNKELFPGVVDTKLIDFNNPDVKIRNVDNIIIMTRGHIADFQVLEFALKSECSYLGLIGSKTKWNFTINKLSEDGFTEKDWNRVYNPIGLEIHAETPDEIAISIAAEMIKHRAKPND